MAAIPFSLTECFCEPSSQASIVTLTHREVMHSRKRENEPHSAASPTSLCCRLNVSDVVPYEESPIAFLSVGVGFQAMPPGTEMAANGAKG